MKSITVPELKAALTSSKPPLLLDVRRRLAFESSAELMAGAAWRDPEEVAGWFADIDPGRPVVVYCVHGHEVSQGCARRLEALGCAAAYLEGGIEAWRAAGGPMSASPGQRRPGA